MNKKPERHLLGSDAAAMFQGMRDIFNVRIAKLRGTHRNPEQDPDKSARLRVDAGVELKRDDATPEQTELGPVSARRPNARERFQAKGKEVVADAKAKPAGALVELIDFASEIGIKKFVFSGLKNIILARRGIRRLGEINDLLTERKRVQDPNHLVERLSWLANFGAETATQSQEQIDKETPVP